jgi:hypothetical protein
MPLSEGIGKHEIEVCFEDNLIACGQTYKHALKRWREWAEKVKSRGNSFPQPRMGFDVTQSRSDWTALELFSAAVQTWPETFGSCCLRRDSYACANQAFAASIWLASKY